MRWAQPSQQVAELKALIVEWATARQQAELQPVERQRLADLSLHSLPHRSRNRNQNQSQLGRRVLLLSQLHHVHRQLPDLHLSTTPLPTASRAHAAPSAYQ